MSDELKYSAKQISELVGMPLSNISYLERYGVVIPSRIKSEQGRRAQEIALYTAEDLEKLELIWRIDRLLAPKGLKKAIELGKLEEIVEILG